MELFIINTYLSLLIFNPLEAAVLFLAATGDFRQVFSKRFIKHWFILGSINFVFQYLASCLDIGFARLFANYISSIVIMGMILLFYFKYILKINIKISIILYSVLFNIVTILFILTFSKNIITYNFNVYEEIVTNLLIKIIQFLLLNIFYGGIYRNEKFCKKHFEKSK